MGHQAAQVVQLAPEVRNKTQQRISALVSLLRENPRQAFAYSDLMAETGMAYDTCLYCLHTLAEVGMVTKVETPDGPGRPKVTFQWAGARVLGTRTASA